MTLFSRAIVALLIVPGVAVATPPARPPAVPPPPGLSTVQIRMASRRDQNEAIVEMRQGRLRPLRDIESRVIPRMGGADYLGPEFDRATGNYRLKFMRGGSIIWVDVDGRSGEILGRSGE